MPIMASCRAVPRSTTFRIGLGPFVAALIWLALPATAFGGLDEPLTRKTLCAKKGTGVLRVVTGELGPCRSNERRVILKVPRTAKDEGGATEPVVIPDGGGPSPGAIVLPSPPTSTAGPAGPQGPIGPPGPQGPAGATGAAGPAGPAGAAGNAGPPGPQGPVGPAGAQGPAGSAGAQGATGPQ